MEPLYALVFMLFCFAPWVPLVSIAQSRKVEGLVKISWLILWVMCVFVLPFAIAYVYLVIISGADTHDPGAGAVAFIVMAPCSALFSLGLYFLFRSRTRHISDLL
jgi:hypothetical protein